MRHVFSVATQIKKSGVPDHQDCLPQLGRLQSTRPWMAILVAQLPITGNYDNGLQQAWHTLHSVAQPSSISGDSGSTDGAQLDYVQYCQVQGGRRVSVH